MSRSTGSAEPTAAQRTTGGGQAAAPSSTPPAHGNGDPRANGHAVRVADPPRVADGTELLGEYEGSAFKEPPDMVRRADGQIVQLPAALYGLLELLDGRRGYDDLAGELSGALHRQVGADDVRFLVTEKLAPLGVVATDGGPALHRADPLLALRLRKAVIPPRAVRAATALFRPLFFPPVLVAAAAGFIAFDVWLFSHHGIAQSIRAVLYQPAVLLLLFALVVLAAAFHELGHATGCRYGGAEPGAMGVGLYIVWPAFYTDISESHRLRRGGRLRADLGGVYFHGLFILGLAGVFALTRYEPLLLVAILLQVEMVRQMLPLLRFDGYYVISDLVGIPDLFLRLKPILLSLVPGRPPHPKVAELKTWARTVVTVWVLLVIVALSFYLSVVAVATPRIVGTAVDSFRAHVRSLSTAWDAGATLRAILSGIQLVALSLPALGIGYTVVMFGRRFVRAWRSFAGRPVARSLLVAATLAVLAVLAYLWVPRGADYRPIGPNERWTAESVVAAAAHHSVIDPSPTSGSTGFASRPGPTASPPTTPTTATSPPATASAAPSATPTGIWSPTASPSGSWSPSVSGSPTPATSPRTATPSPSSSASAT